MTIQVALTTSTLVEIFIVCLSACFIAHLFYDFITRDESEGHYNDIQGISCQEQYWLDEFAHGLVTDGGFTWVLKLVRERKSK